MLIHVFSFSCKFLSFRSPLPLGLTTPVCYLGALPTKPPPQPKPRLGLRMELIFLTHLFQLPGTGATVFLKLTKISLSTNFSVEYPAHSHLVGVI